MGPRWRCVIVPIRTIARHTASRSLCLRLLFQPLLVLPLQSHLKWEDYSAYDDRRQGMKHWLGYHDRPRGGSSTGVISSSAEGNNISGTVAPDAKIVSLPSVAAASNGSAYDRNGDPDAE